MQIKVFGCKVNKYYTDKWLNSDYLRDQNGVFVASCVVTDNAKRKWIKFVKDTAKELEGEDKIFISGCGAFKEGKAQDDFFDLYPQISDLRDKIVILGEDPENEKHKLEKPKVKLDASKIKAIPQLYTKKFVLIQGGCDSFCTFCLTVQKRGRHYSRSEEDIAAEIEEFAQNGGKEAVLTGVNLSAWGLKTTNDIGKSRFAELLTYLLEHTTIPRLRVSSLGPEFINDEVLEVFKHTRIYPHFHYSVQAGSSNTLKSMARHYDGDYMTDLLNKTRNIQREDGISVSLGADIIVGFPGETEEDFMDTYNLVKDCKITKVHAFPFSAHKMGESVPAGLFKEQLDDATKKDRMNRITQIGDEIRAEFIASQKGKQLKVLIESIKDGVWKGWSENYIECTSENFEVTSGEVKRNEIITGTLK